ncbi:Gfo/Idh/MocA family oxidoreductase [Mucisphaera sp.]|uniref:Gfo/Idh/MocA family oxidoreductase n=1 Tax=Mucisphaera sp. TaxID=2913024 RepID=UPI003D11430A
MTDDGILDVAVIGVGRMGSHHARTYKNLPQARLVAVVDADEDRAFTVADQYGCEAYTSPEELIEKQPGLRAATVAVPTQMHMAAARPLLERKIACLVEKPLAPSRAEARELATLAQMQGAVLQVGHTERFNPAVRAVAAMGITPRFIEVDRVSPMTFRSLDVGVVMDMMIHDLDIIHMLVDSEVQRVEAAGISVVSEYEDVANARFVFESGCVANVTASRLALKTERKMRIFSEKAYVSLDYGKRSGVVIKLAENAEALDEIRRLLQDGTDLTELDYSSLVNLDELTMELPAGEEDPLTAELSSFLEAARTGDRPAVDAEAGYTAVNAAERVLAAMRAHRWEGISGSKI